MTKNKGEITLAVGELRVALLLMFLFGFAVCYLLLVVMVRR